MAETTLEEFLGDNHDAILVGARARMRGNDTMIQMAAQRELRESELLSQVLDFYLQAIRTDVTLGSAVAMEQGLRWLVRLREGQGLTFDDSMVTRLFGDLSNEIDARLDSQALRQEYATYREQVRSLITEAFPEAGQAGA